MLHFRQVFTMAELYQLQEQEIPEAMRQLHDSHTNLKKVADYCEGLYLQAEAAEKRPALEETRGYTTQALASVAYQINTLATSFLSLLDLQANQLGDMESNISHLAQTVAIHKEKVARREIGVLTTNKSFFKPPGVKTPGIIFPDQPEKTLKYVRKPIDYTILDGVGRGGVKVAQLSQRNRGDAGSHRSNSMSSTLPPSSHPPTPPGTMIQTSTLTRGGHYRQGQMKAGVIAPPIAPPTVPSHYMSAHQLQQAQQQGNPFGIANATYAAGHMQTPPPPPPNVDMPPPMMGHMDQVPPPPPSQYSQGLHNGDTANSLPPLSPPLPPPMTGVDDYTMNQDMPPPPPPADEALSDEPDATAQDRHSMGQPPPPPPIQSVDDYNGHMLMTQNPPWAPVHYMEKVVAIFDYEPQNDDELRFRENTVIYVINKNADGWWEGVMEQDGMPACGLFPENYVEALI